jgi:hypothetical protein
MSGFDRKNFDETGLKILDLAHAEGEIVGLHYFGGENWLLGLVAGHVIGGSTVQITYVRETIKRIMGDPSPGGYFRDQNPTPVARSIYQKAFELGEGRVSAESLAQATQENEIGVAGWALQLLNKEIERRAARNHQAA